MADEPDKASTYAQAGVDDAAQGLAALVVHVRETRSNREGPGAMTAGDGFFAAILRLSDRLSLAVSTDGVGSKSMVAQATGHYEPIGWDAVAVNVNDVVCTGATPVALLDYISLQEPHPALLDALGVGMRKAAERARVAIVGGELSQHPDSLTGPRPGWAFDVSATCIGLLQDAEPLLGADVRPGDIVLGLPSNGIHANGLTLARHVLLGDGGSLGFPLPGCEAAGVELLRPTHIYVPEALALLEAGVPVHGLAHISGDGLLNLARLEADVGYRLDSLPPVQPIFEAIRELGNVEAAEMFRVFNMGVGFCVVVPRDAVDGALSAIAGAGGEAQPIGAVVDGPRRIEVTQYHLVGTDGAFTEL